jgi:tetratricopeptide (TPR) repeat protein
MAVAGVARRMLFLAAVLVVAVALPIPADTSPPAGQEIAKAPTESGPPTAAAPVEQKAAPAQPAPEAGKPSTQPAGKPTQIAQLPAMEPAESVASLIDKAEDCAWHRDYVGRRFYLERAAALSPGSKEAACALVFLAETDAKEGSPSADALFAQAVAEYPDAEIQAFSTLVQSWVAAEKAADWERALVLFTDAANTWIGTSTGGWAALQLGGLYRDDLEDIETAKQVYEQTARAYAGTPVGTEALIGLGDCLNWGELRPGDALEFYRQAREAATSVRLEMRALLGEADCLRQTGDYSGSYWMLSELIAQYPNHPAMPRARIHRAAAAEKFGYWETVPDDARAYLASPIRQPWWTSYAHILLGSDAFRNGLLEEAEAEFTAVLSIPKEPELKGRAHAGIASCQATRGDLRSAVASYLEAADEGFLATERCLFLYQAACTAQAAGDRVAADKIINQMVAEYPGSHLTTRLVGHEILPTPEI